MTQHELNVENALGQHDTILRAQLRELKKRNPAYAEVPKAKQPKTKFDYFIYGTVFGSLLHLALRFVA